MLFRTLRLTALAAIAAASFAAAPAHAGQTVAYSGDAPAGTIVVDTANAPLYLVTARARRSVYRRRRPLRPAIGSRDTRIVSKHIKPAWKPPESIRGRRSP
jgi:hypothetical protein